MHEITWTSELFYSSAIFALFSLVIVFPPQEARQAGFTIPVLFSFIIGSERINFVEYHLRRACLTLLIHAALPLVFTIIFTFQFVENAVDSKFTATVQWIWQGSLLIVSGALAYITYVSYNGFVNHPISRNIAQWTEPDEDFRQIVDQLNVETRDFSNFSVDNHVGYSKVIVTDHWAIQTSMYSLRLIRIDDARFRVVSAAEHPLLTSSTDEVQLIDVLVESVSSRSSPFTIRLRSRAMLHDLQVRLGRNIDVVDRLEFIATVNDKFVEVFDAQINENPRFDYDHRFELEPCLGCQFTIAEVKLMKQCIDDGEQVGCRSCACKPMWCAGCIARIFASKQNRDHPETWMSGRAECPTCRAPFCALDVCRLAERPQAMNE